MPTREIREFLEDRGVEYDTIEHLRTITAQRTAETTHIPGREVAKTVVVKLGGELAMAVVPASEDVDLTRLREVAGTDSAELVDETEFEGLFPGCEVGAMPPLGNLYGLDVFVDDRLAEDERIAFNAGTHTELVQLAYSDFERLVSPTVARFGFPAGEERP